MRILYFNANFTFKQPNRWKIVMAADVLSDMSMLVIKLKLQAQFDTRNV